MSSCRHDRLADDMREIGADGEIPVHPDCAQRRPGDETAPDAEKPAQDPDQETDDHQVNRTDVRPRDREMHREKDHSERPRKRRKRKVVTHFEENGLADDQADGDESVKLDVFLIKMSQPVGQKMKDKEKVDNNQDAVDHELSQEGEERLARVGFH